MSNPRTLFPSATRDEEYFDLLARALSVCAQYKPMFGQGRAGGVTLEQFRIMYGSDPFYSWIGLDSPLMYAAHKAAGGMTSIYRKPEPWYRYHKKGPKRSHPWEDVQRCLKRDEPKKQE